MWKKCRCCLQFCCNTYITLIVIYTSNRILNLPWRSGESFGFWNQDREFESLNVHFPSIQIIYFFLVFPFYFSQFRSKTMCEYILKGRQYRITNGKEVKPFLFFSKIANVNTPHKGTIRNIAWLHVSRFLFKIQWGKGNSLRLATFFKNNISSHLWYTSSVNWKSSIVLIYYKSEDWYPNFVFFYLLLIPL